MRADVLVANDEHHGSCHYDSLTTTITWALGCGIRRLKVVQRQVQGWCNVGLGLVLGCSGRFAK